MSTAMVAEQPAAAPAAAKEKGEEVLAGAVPGQLGLLAAEAAVQRHERLLPPPDWGCARRPVEVLLALLRQDLGETPSTPSSQAVTEQAAAEQATAAPRAAPPGNGFAMIEAHGRDEVGTRPDSNRTLSSATLWPSAQPGRTDSIDVPIKAFWVTDHVGRSFLNRSAFRYILECLGNALSHTALDELESEAAGFPGGARSYWCRIVEDHGAILTDEACDTRVRARLCSDLSAACRRLHL